MTAKHTPGPWVVCVQEGDDVAYTVFAKSQLRDGRIAPEDWDNCIASAGLNHQEVEQNARLIAAAPELYEALEIFAAIPLEDFGWDDRSDDRPISGFNKLTLTVGHVRAARRALAKARGEA